MINKNKVLEMLNAFNDVITSSYYPVYNSPKNNYELMYEKSKKHIAFIFNNKEEALFLDNFFMTLMNKNVEIGDQNDVSEIINSLSIFHSSILENDTVELATEYVMLRSKDGEIHGTIKIRQNIYSSIIENEWNHFFPKFKLLILDLFKEKKINVNVEILEDLEKKKSLSNLHDKISTQYALNSFEEMMSNIDVLYKNFVNCKQGQKLITKYKHYFGNENFVNEIENILDSFRFLRNSIGKGQFPEIKNQKDFFSFWNSLSNKNKKRLARLIYDTHCLLFNQLLLEDAKN